MVKIGGCSTNINFLFFFPPIEILAVRTNSSISELETFFYEIRWIIIAIDRVRQYIMVHING